LFLFCMSVCVAVYLLYGSSGVMLSKTIVTFWVVQKLGVLFLWSGAEADAQTGAGKMLTTLRASGVACVSLCYVSPPDVAV